MPREMQPDQNLERHARLLDQIGEQPAFQPTWRDRHDTHDLLRGLAEPCEAGQHQVLNPLQGVREGHLVVAVADQQQGVRAGDAQAKELEQVEHRFSTASRSMSAVAEGR